MGLNSNTRVVKILEMLMRVSYSFSDLKRSAEEELITIKLNFNTRVMDLK